MPVHAHSCDGFQPTDKLTLQVVVVQDTEGITCIQVPSLGYNVNTFWQCNPRITACLQVEHDEQLVCSYGRVALMLSDCVGSAKHHKLKFEQHNDTGDKEVDSFLLLFIDFTNRTTTASLLCTEDHNSCYRNVCKMSVVSFALAVVFIIHYMNCQTEYQLHQLLKTTKNLFPSDTLQALTSTATGAVAVGDGLMSVACKKTTLKNWEAFKKIQRFGF